MSISHLARSIGESATLKLNERAKLLADQVSRLFTWAENPKQSADQRNSQFCRS
jgi:hypothetical protein